MLQWTPGSKHPVTPTWVFKNVWGHGTMRDLVKTRCALCPAAISSDDDRCKKLVINCGKKECSSCSRAKGEFMHSVCDVCYSMWHALYFNSRLTDGKYFKKLDEADAKGYDRKRMGLDETQT